MKVYVVMDDRFPDPEGVFLKRKHALKFVRNNPWCAPHLMVFKFKPTKKSWKAGLGGGERVVTDPSSY